MESMAHIQYNSAAPGVLLTSVGDLKLKLREPLEHKGEDTRYNVSTYFELKLLHILSCGLSNFQSYFTLIN